MNLSQTNRYTRKAQLQRGIKPNLKQKKLQKVRKPKVLRGRP